MTVSYTHLDVYKRQLLDWPIKYFDRSTALIIICIFQIEVEFALNEEHMRDIFTEFRIVNTDEEVEAFQIHKCALQFVEYNSFVEDVSIYFKDHFIIKLSVIILVNV